MEEEIRLYEMAKTRTDLRSVGRDVVGAKLYSPAYG